MLDGGVFFKLLVSAMRGIISKPGGFVFDRNDFVDNNIINAINGTGVVQYLYKRFMGIFFHTFHFFSKRTVVIFPERCTLVLT